MQSTLTRNPVFRLDYLAKFAFITLLFFTFYGTSMPFTEGLQDEYTSNPINQYGYGLILIISMVSLIGKGNLLFKLIMKEKFLSFFVLWCLLSIAWSNYSFISFKRFILLLSIVTTSVAFLLSIRSSKESLKYFEIILFSYLILSLIASLIIPAALDPKFGTWRGLAPTKNNLGQVGMVGVILSAVFFNQGNFRQKMLSLMMIFISFALLLGSRSMTSLVALIFVAFMFLMVFTVHFIFSNPLISKILIILATLGLISIVGGIIILEPEFFLELPQYIGKDASFTGRDGIWVFVLDEVTKHPFIGTGYSSFWIPGNDVHAYFLQKYFWIPNQAHNGYLDILNQTGIIGISLVLLLIVKYLWNISTVNNQDYWKWLIVAILVINMTESTLFRSKHLLNVLFIFSYLAFYVDLINSNIRFKSKPYLG